MQRRSTGYANAGRLLPKPLVRELQRYFEGGLLWVPFRSRRLLKTRTHAARNRRIREDRCRGLTMSALARKYYLSEERIRQILRGDKPGN